ncbi:MAG TPA: response regulator transcription factor [Candidatus Baltobacteraceae bacterium]|nr:response regulator transcription factor [Candidatus Baltobacteraceae bacterium]
MNILIADDQAEFRSGLRDLLSSAPGVEVIGEASNGDEAVAAALRLDPDITLMDIRMPVMDGIAATLAIRSRNPQACVLVLTTFDEDRLVRESMRAGACGYLLKGTPLEDMLAIFALAVRGYTAIGKGVRLPDHHQHADERIAQLSEREREILALIGDGLTNRDIASTLFLTEGTVKNYVTQILSALGVRHRTEAALLWRRHS